MNEHALFHADASRRGVLLGGLVGAVAAGLPLGAFAQTCKQDPIPSHTSTGTKTMNTIATKDRTVPTRSNAKAHI